MTNLKLGPLPKAGMKATRRLPTRLSTNQTTCPTGAFCQFAMAMP
jgi:hypothetical protein